MKKVNLIILLVILTVLGCKNDDEVKTEDRLEGNWQFSFSERGSEQTSLLGQVSYIFRDDKTFTKNLGMFNWRDEGTWSYNKTSKTLSLIYKTYSNETSDVKTSDIQVEKITDKELVFKEEYNKMNSVGEFVEFEFVHYYKK